jgi:hypothetical protein
VNDRARPQRLFRYFPEKASDFFSARKLWFSALKDYNDPFDTLPRFDIMQESQRKHAIMREFAFLPSGVEPNWQTFRKTKERESSDFLAEGCEVLAQECREWASKHLRLVCFSEQVTELLMWAHYASSHRGFVIEFDPKHALFASDEFRKVDYVLADERPTVEDVEDQSQEDFRKMLCRKSRDWDYEAEWRLVKLANSLDVGRRRDGLEMSCLELPSGSVRALYLGWQLPRDKGDELLQSIEKDEWHRVKRFIMRPDKAKYAIEPIPWDQWRARPDTFRKECDRLTMADAEPEESE